MEVDKLGEIECATSSLFEVTWDGLEDLVFLVLCYIPNNKMRYLKTQSDFVNYYSVLPSSTRTRRKGAQVGQGVKRDKRSRVGKLLNGGILRKRIEKKI